MEAKTKKEIIFGLVTLVAIVAIIALAFHITSFLERRDKSVSDNDTVCVVRYDETSLNALRKENSELYEEMKRLKNAESAIEIRYKYVYSTDTVRVTEFVYGSDSVYHFECDNDTIRTSVDVKARGLDWCFFTTEFNGKFTIINQNDGGQNITTIEHDQNVEIIGEPTVWHRKTTWREALTIGPTVGVGYGFVNRKPDVYIGFTVGYNLLSIRKKN